MGTIPPDGWYVDPLSELHLRYFENGAWTHEVQARWAAPIPSAPAASPAVAASGLADQRPLPKGILVAAALVSVVIIVVAATSHHRTSTSTSSPYEANAAAAPSSGANALASWWAKVETSYHAVEADLAAADRDAAVHNTTALSSDCRRLTVDTDKLQGDPPAPVASVNTPYHAALTDFAGASDECTAGIATHSPSLMAQAEGVIADGSTQLARATEQVDGLLRTT